MWKKVCVCNYIYLVVFVQDCRMSSSPVLTRVNSSKMASKELRRKLTPTYPFGGPSRFPVPDDKIDWDVPFDWYNPPSFTTKKVLTASWADPEDVSSIKFNSVDGKIKRTSYGGPYKIAPTGHPLNPVGRTGIQGRGNLGKWGPNHAADPVVTKWKCQDGCNNSSTKILQFIAIQRRDTEEWAIPGGMVDPGETATSALKREFLEEVFSSEDKNEGDKAKLESAFQGLFDQGVEVYKGYVDDPRNTDNAWMETDCRTFHTDDPNIMSLPLKAGSDAKNAQWVDISSSLSLYASHKAFIRQVAELRNASW